MFIEVDGELINLNNITFIRKVLASKLVDDAVREGKTSFIIFSRGDY